VDLSRGVCVIPPEVRKGRRKAGVYHLPPELAADLAAIKDPARELVFPWPMSDASYWKHWDRILKNAGLPTGRKFKTHCLRVTHASWRKRLGDDPTKSLMHSDPATTARHYLDKRFEPPPKPLPDPRRGEGWGESDSAA
ncbi:MAG: site-specific integrase, partial [Gemmataceae bacterium]|nr:site-specific integrase [Gemmataceae bacterium]